MGTEAFPNVADEDLAAVIQSFVAAVAKIAGTTRFHCVVALWSEVGVTSCSSTSNTELTRAALESVLADMVETGKREVAAKEPS